MTEMSHYDRNVTEMTRPGSSKMKTVASFPILLWCRLNMNSSFESFPTLIFCSTVQDTVTCNAAGNAVLPPTAVFYVRGT